ncbi:hypothetical protein E2I00_014963, partial [Balaenoptera physalus]
VANQVVQALLTQKERDKKAVWYNIKENGTFQFGKQKRCYRNQQLTSWEHQASVGAGDSGVKCISSRAVVHKCHAEQSAMVSDGQLGSREAKEVQKAVLKIFKYSADRLNKLICAIISAGRLSKADIRVHMVLVLACKGVFTKNWSSTLCRVKDHGQQQDKRQQKLHSRILDLSTGDLLSDVERSRSLTHSRTDVEMHQSSQNWDKRLSIDSSLPSGFASPTDELPPTRIKESHILEGLRKLQKRKVLLEPPSVITKWGYKDCMNSNEGIYSPGIKSSSLKEYAPCKPTGTGSPCKEPHKAFVYDTDSHDDAEEDPSSLASLQAVPHQGCRLHGCKLTHSVSDSLFGWELNGKHRSEITSSVSPWERPEKLTSCASDCPLERKLCPSVQGPQVQRGRDPHSQGCLPLSLQLSDTDDTETLDELHIESSDEKSPSDVSLTTGLVTVTRKEISIHQAPAGPQTERTELLPQGIAHLQPGATARDYPFLKRSEEETERNIPRGEADDVAVTPTESFHPRTVTQNTQRQRLTKPTRATSCQSHSRSSVATGIYQKKSLTKIPTRGKSSPQKSRIMEPEASLTVPSTGPVTLERSPAPGKLSRFKKPEGPEPLFALPPDSHIPKPSTQLPHGSKMFSRRDWVQYSRSQMPASQLLPRPPAEPSRSVSLLARPGYDYLSPPSWAKPESGIPSEAARTVLKSPPLKGSSAPIIYFNQTVTEVQGKKPSVTFKKPVFTSPPPSTEAAIQTRCPAHSPSSSFAGMAPGPPKVSPKRSVPKTPPHQTLGTTQTDIGLRTPKNCPSTHEPLEIPSSKGVSPARKGQLNDSVPTSPKPSFLGVNESPSSQVNSPSSSAPSKSHNTPHGCQNPHERGLKTRLPVGLKDKPGTSRNASSLEATGGERNVSPLGLRAQESLAEGLPLETATPETLENSTPGADGKDAVENKSVKRSLSSNKPLLKPALGMNGAKARSQSFSAQSGDKPPTASMEGPGKVRTQIITNTAERGNSLTRQSSSTEGSPSKTASAPTSDGLPGAGRPLGHPSSRQGSLGSTGSSSSQHGSPSKLPLRILPKSEGPLAPPGTEEQQAYAQGEGARENVEKGQVQTKSTSVDAKPKPGPSFASWFGFRRSRLPALSSRKMDVSKTKAEKKDAKGLGFGNKQLKSERKKEKKKPELQCEMENELNRDIELADGPDSGLQNRNNLKTPPDIYDQVKFESRNRPSPVPCSTKDTFMTELLNRVDKKAAQQTESGSNNVSCRSVLKGSSQGSCVTGSSLGTQGTHKKNIKTKADMEIPKGSLKDGIITVQANDAALHIRAAVGCPGFLSDRDLEDGCYPPGPRPPAGGGGSYHPHHDGHGNTLGGDSYPSFGNPQGNVIAKLVSPIVSVVVVTLDPGSGQLFPLLTLKRYKADGDDDSPTFQQIKEANEHLQEDEEDTVADSAFQSHTIVPLAANSQYLTTPRAMLTYLLKLVETYPNKLLLAASNNNRTD